MKTALAKQTKHTRSADGDGRHESSRNMLSCRVLLLNGAINQWRLNKLLSTEEEERERASANDKTKIVCRNAHTHTQT